MGPVIQAEFWHITIAPGSGQTLEDLYDEMGIRWGEGSSIKTAVRFYDDEFRSVTTLVERCKKLGDERERWIHVQSEGGSRFAMWRADMRWRRAASKKAQLLKRMQSLVTRRIAAAAPSLQLAVERHNRSFRHVRDDEVHELVESVRASTGLFGVWSFEPDKLTTDHPRTIVATMFP